MVFPGKRLLIAGCAGLVAVAGGAWVALEAQQPGRSRADRTTAGGPEARQVVIEREALRLRDPRTFQVPLQLAAGRSVELTAAADGFVRSVRIETGQTLEAQEEAVRLDGAEAELLVERARAGVKVAEIELRAAQGSGDAVAAELAAARIEVARADVDLANLRLERTIVRAPFAGRILRTTVTPGAYVRAGEPLATLAQTQQLKVEIPVDRAQVAAGKPLEIRVEDQTVQGTVSEILPLAERFEPLRTIIPSAASAIVVLENTDGRFHVGQTIYAPLIPRHPVAEVPTATLSNLADGGRKVQVLRGDTVRDVEVRLLGQVGIERIYVSGAFAEGDELVLAASQTLADGMRVRPSTPVVPETAAANGPTGTRDLPTPSGPSPARPATRF